MTHYFVIARLGISRGNLTQYVMLSEVEASPRHTLYYVILSVTKDLKACAAVHRHGDLEILHFVQNDNTSHHY